MPDPASNPAPPYRKLTRMHRGLGSMSQLWLGSDHLLHVQSTGYSETYRRFYLRDIQCLMIVHGGRRTFVASTIAVLLMIVGIIIAASGGGLMAFAIGGGLFLPLFVWNHLLGPGCRVVVVTAVQQENIHALCRLPKTRRVLQELKPLIEAAQADLSGVPAGDAAAVTADQPPFLPPSLPPPLPPA